MPLSLSVAIRVHGSHQMGMGHIFRMLALAEEMARRGGCRAFFITEPDAQVANMMRENGFEAETIAAHEGNYIPAAAIIRDFAPEVLINDILDTSSVYMEAVRPLVGRIVNLDDQGAGLAWADLVINSLPSRFVTLPQSTTRSRYIEGPEYLILARDFQSAWGTCRPISSNCANILVTLGGSDTYGFSILVARALRQIEQLRRIEVVVGPSFRHQDDLAQAIAGDRRFVVSATVPSLARVMDTHELAVTGGGITLFEAAAMGLPTLAIASEDFERVNILWGQTKGFTCYAGEGWQLSEGDIANKVRSLLCDHSLRKALSQQGPKVVDGQGTRRVAEIILDKASCIP